MDKIMVTKGKAQNGSVSLAYEVFGESGEPLLLIMGVGMQMLMWHDDFCRDLASRGFQVARMDNRDVGLSTHLAELGEPKLFDMIWRPKKAARYSLEDMAQDAVAVLDSLGWKSAHIVGGSLGGMIAQQIAVSYPERVRSLTSIMASPSFKIGRAKTLFSIKVGGLLAQPVHNESEAADQQVAVFKLLGTPERNYPLDEKWLREVGAESFRRAYDPAGKLRQQAAMMAAPNRTKALQKLRVPTLVMHGEVDPMIRLKGGIATAKAIPGAKLVVLKGVGHGAFPREVWPVMINNICGVTVAAR
ncbi:MAG TPA: alpha/beta hydrolase [Candidatus Saccharimonadales bacterium]